MARTEGADEGKAILLSGATSSASTFITIRRWLHDCNTAHSDCARPTLDQPKEASNMVRFLEIRDDVLILAEHTQYSRLNCPRYACLSHCLGSGAEIVKTLEVRGSPRHSIHNRWPRCARRHSQSCHHPQEGITREMYVVFLVLETVSEQWRHKALIVARTERPNESCRLGTAEFDLVSHRNNIDAWRSVNDERDCDYPPERVEAYPDELISVLEAETRIITLV
jgi:hypothetical protein